MFPEDGAGWQHLFPYRHHTVRNDCQLSDCYDNRNFGSSPAVVQPECIGNPGAVSGDAKQPSKVRSGSYADRVDGKSCAYHHRGGGFRSCVRLNPDAAVRIFLYGSGSDPVDYTLGGTKKDVLTKVLLPGSVPLILSNMKVNVGLCLVGVIIGEFLAARRGLGYLIIYGSQVFQLDCVVLSIVLLCLFSSLFYRMIAGRE